MVFNSQSFLFFFPIVVLMYAIIPARFRRIWLLCASYYFYMNWNAKYGLLLLTVTLISYFVGRLLACKELDNYRKHCLGGGISATLLILIFFKYFNFFIDNLNLLCTQVLGYDGLKIDALDIILPMGISFYTFQAIGYIVDVYRKKVEAEKNVITYALYVSFFPQLVAGPIERSSNLLAQIKNIEKVIFWDYHRIKNGFWQILWGLFIKIVIADRAAILVDYVFKEYYRFGTVELCLAAMIFAIQIYCDFGGYSIIAQGCAEVLGVKLVDNFAAPYFAGSIKEFWSRWHISLSSWLKDYVYIPLGGSRCSDFKKYRNYLLTFLISGIWHGASWNYIVWGVIHGIYQILEMCLKPFREICIKRVGAKTEVFSFKLLRRCSTFFLVDFAWIFFRSDSMKMACEYIKRIFLKWNPWALADGRIFLMGLEEKDMKILLIAIIVLVVADILKYKYNQKITSWVQKQNIWFEWMIFSALFFGTIIYGIYGPGIESAQFIYFQF